MATITAAQVKELRTRSGAGMMDCKKALVETEGNIEAAFEFLQKKGIAKAGKKAGRIAAEGLVSVHTAADGSSATLVEVNCETDFVARNDAFQLFVKTVAELAHKHGITDVEALNGLTVEGGKTVAEWTTDQISGIGENIKIRRIAHLVGDTIGHYTHAGSQIGVLIKVSGSGDNGEFARNIAMHVAASNPNYTRSEEIEASVREKQREILTAQALDSGKPANIVEKMVEGRLRKWTAEITLLDQPYVKNPDLTVAKYQKQTGDITIDTFVRYQVGEGIEKKESNLADEVAAQLGG